MERSKKKLIRRYAWVGSISLLLLIETTLALMGVCHTTNSMPVRVLLGVLALNPFLLAAFLLWVLGSESKN